MNDAGASAIVAGVSALLLEALGVDAYVVAVSCIGAVMLQAWSTTPTGRARAMVQIVTGGLVGAMIAQGIVDHTGLQSRAVLMALAAFFGFSAYQFFGAMASRFDSFIGAISDRWGRK